MLKKKLFDTHVTKSFYSTKISGKRGFTEPNTGQKRTRPKSPAAEPDGAASMAVVLELMNSFRYYVLGKKKIRCLGRIYFGDIGGVWENRAVLGQALSL